MAQIIDFKNPQAVKATAQGLSDKMALASAERKSVFENLLTEVEKVNPAMGGFEEIGALLALPDGQFSIIAPIFLDEMAKSINNIDDKLLLIQAMNVSGTKLEDLQQAYLKLAEAIDAQYSEILSAELGDKNMPAQISRALNFISRFNIQDSRFKNQKSRFKVQSSIFNAHCSQLTSYK